MEKQFKNMMNILIEYYDGDYVSLVEDYDNIGAYKLVSGGCFAISYHDQRADLQACGHNVDLMSNDELYEYYCDIVVDELGTYLG